MRLLLINAPCFYDTSALLAGKELEPNSFISPVVLEELEQIKTSSTKDATIKYKARTLVRYLMAHQWSSSDCPGWSTSGISMNTIRIVIGLNRQEKSNDNKILWDAILFARKTKQQVNFFTADACQYLAACLYPKELVVCYYNETNKQENLWKGYQDIFLTDDDVNTFYQHPEINTFGLAVNEYAILYHNNEQIDIIKWNGEKYQSLKYKDLNTDYFGKVKPLNIQQKMFFDLLQDNNIPYKLVRGQYGSGKTFLALAHALHFIKSHKYDKIIFIRNNVDVAGSKDLGALPGEQFDKLLPFIMPLADHLGSVDMLRDYVMQDIIEPVHLGYLRGRNFENSIILVDEAENLTTDNIKLITGRVGKNSTLWVLGDESQTDSDIFRKNSGIASLLHSLRDEPLFGTIELQKSERSSVAQLAAKIK